MIGYLIKYFILFFFTYTEVPNSKHFLKKNYVQVEVTKSVQ